MQRIGRPIKQCAIVEASTPAVSAQSNSRVENPANIQITNIAGSTAQPIAGIDTMASALDTGGPEHWGADGSESKLPRLGTSTFTPSEPPAVAAPIPGPKGMKERAIELDEILHDEVLDPNPKLHRFRAQRLDNVEYVADVAFLEHVLHTLLRTIISP
jgi:hypothetical protein